MAMWRIFWGFCRNWFLIDPLHYLSRHSDFGFKFKEILNRKTTPRLGESGSRRLSNSPSRRVVESSLYRSSKGSSSNTFKCGPVIAKRSEAKLSESFDNVFFSISKRSEHVYIKDWNFPCTPHTPMPVWSNTSVVIRNLYCERGGGQQETSGRNLKG